MAQEPDTTDAAASIALIRFDAWPEHERETFLDILAGTSNIADACAAVKRSRGAIARLRQIDPVFARAFDDALEAGYHMLEADLLDRARNGISKTVIDRKNEQVKLTEFDCKLGLSLLERQAKKFDRAPAASTPEATSIAEQDQIMAGLAKRVEELKQERLAIITAHLKTQQ